MDDDLKTRIVELIRRTATEMPEDVVSYIKDAYEKETNKLGKEILSDMIKNIELAREKKKPLCQDTGTPIFYVRCPDSYSRKELKEAINEATRIATEEVPLRGNAVDTITGKNIGNVPQIHFEEGDKLKISLLLKGGGSENVSLIYKLPDKALNAHRDLEGVRKVVLDSVFKAQGNGCPPYIVGVGIGGNVEQVAHLAKKQLLRKLDDENKIPELKVFEERLLPEINKMKIGSLGLGGNTTAIGVKVGAEPRHPASFFVGISIGCWSMRRGEL